VTTVNIVLPVFLVIGLGWWLRVRRFLAPETVAGLSRLVFYVAAPLLLLRSLARTPLDLGVQLPVIGTMAGASALVAAATYLAVRSARPSRRGVLAQGAHRSNMVFFGLPVVVNAYGEQAVGVVALLIGFTVIVYNLLAVLLLTLPHRGVSARDAAVWRDTLARMARNPLILGCAGGVLLSSLHVTLPWAVDRSLELVGRTALPLALLALGADLDPGRLRLELGPALGVASVKLIVYPALVWAGLHHLGMEGTALQAPVLLAASPTAVVSFIMAREMGGDGRLAGAIVIGTTLLSLVTVVGWLLCFHVT